MSAVASVREVAVPPPAKASSTLSHVDYSDAFLVEIDPADDRSPEQWARAMLERTSSGTRRALSRGWAALGLQLGSTESDRFVLGWPIRHSDADALLLGARSRLGFSAELLFERQPGALLFSTLVQQDNPLTRVLWAGLGPPHRRVVRRLLERAR